MREEQSNSTCHDDADASARMRACRVPCTCALQRCTLMLHRDADIQDQAGQGSEQSHLVVGVPVGCREVELDDLERSLLTQVFLWSDPIPLLSIPPTSTHGAVGI